MLREDNQMLRENLRREQQVLPPQPKRAACLSSDAAQPSQAREDIAKLMREECAALAKRVKDEYEQRAAAQSELDALRLDADAAKLKLREVAEEVERKEKLAQHLRERVEVLEGKVEHKSDELDQAKGRMQSLEDSVREETARGDQERARADRTWEDLTQAREKARNLAAQLNDEQVPCSRGVEAMRGVREVEGESERVMGLWGMLRGGEDGERVGGWEDGVEEERAPMEQRQRMRK
eukprot:170233-Rhodomonas_salina.1